MKITNIERLKQYLGKASFSSAVDRYSALECVAEIERELAEKVVAGETSDDAQEMAQARLDAAVLRDA